MLLFTTNKQEEKKVSSLHLQLDRSSFLMKDGQPINKFAFLVKNSSSPLLKSIEALK